MTDADLSDFYADLASIDNDAPAQPTIPPPTLVPPPPGMPPMAVAIGPSSLPPGFEGARVSAPIGPSMPPPGIPPPPAVRAAPVDPNSIAAKLAALKAAKQQKATTDVRKEETQHPTSALTTPVPPPPMRTGPAPGPPIVAPPVMTGPPRVAPPRPPGMPAVGPPVVAAPTGFAGPPVVAGFMGVPVPPAPAGSEGKGGKADKPKFFREAAGKVWADPSLSEWPENDFRIFVGNVAQDVTDDILAKAFSKYASFNKAKVVKNRKNSKTKGYGFVSFADGADMLLALREMHNKYVGSRPVQLKRSDWKDRDCEIGEAEKRLRDQQAQGGQAKKRKRYHLPTVHLKDG